MDNNTLSLLQSRIPFARKMLAVSVSGDEPGYVSLERTACVRQIVTSD